MLFSTFVAVFTKKMKEFDKQWKSKSILQNFLRTMGPIKKFHYFKNSPQHKKSASEHSIFSPIANEARIYFLIYLYFF